MNHPPRLVGGFRMCERNESEKIWHFSFAESALRYEDQNSSPTDGSEHEETSEFGRNIQVLVPWKMKIAACPI